MSTEAFLLCWWNTQGIAVEQLNNENFHHELAQVRSQAFSRAKAESKQVVPKLLQDISTHWKIKNTAAPYICYSDGFESLGPECFILLAPEILVVVDRESINDHRFLVTFVSLYFKKRSGNKRTCAGIRYPLRTFSVGELSGIEKTAQFSLCPARMIVLKCK